MATTAGVDMFASRLLEEGGRRHFMTQRFDRTNDGSKLHMQPETIVSEVQTTVARWPELAEAAKVAPQWTDEVGQHLRLDLIR